MRREYGDSYGLNALHLFPITWTELSTGGAIIALTVNGNDLVSGSLPKLLQ
jgi:hypothetical protein